MFRAPVFLCGFFWAHMGVSMASSGALRQTDEVFEPDSVSPPPAVFEVGSASKEKSGRARPAFRFSLGYVGYVREARVSHAGVSAAPCYCAASGKKPVLFAGFGYQLEFFPGALPVWGGGQGQWYEGLGVYSEGFVSPAGTAVSGEEKVSSVAMGFQGGAQYRYVWWNSARAPDVRLKMGYSYLRFDLSRGPFPGVELKAPHVGVGITVPVWSDLVWSVSWLGSAQYLYAMSASGGTKALGKPSMGQGVVADTGVRAGYGPFEATLQFQFQQWNMPFEGASSLRAPSPVLKDASLRERAYLTSLFVGYAY